MVIEKKYLKTIEEVSDALATGKVIYNKFKTKIWKDKNGFIVSERKDGSKFLNDYMFTQEDEPYILEPKPLEVKLWHLYEDILGNKILILYKEECLCEIHYKGFIFDCVKFPTFTKRGLCIETGNYNLVKEIADLSQYFEKEEK